MRRLLLVALCAPLLLAGCIEPPLYLPGEENFALDVSLALDTVVDADYATGWIYGWDDADVAAWGPLVIHPVPSRYDVRRYDADSTGWHTASSTTVEDTLFRSYVAPGWHDLTVWSGITSRDGTQVLVVNESDRAVTATSTVVSGTDSRARLHTGDSLASQAQRNSPEMFYAGCRDSIYTSDDVADYDTFDAAHNVWLKRVRVDLRPRVYTYLVQVILHNNDGRVTGCTGSTELSGMASTVDVVTGRTGHTPCLVSFPSRMKAGVTDTAGRRVDVVGGRLNTFGLCDMEPYTPGAGHVYGGAATGNTLLFELVFSNEGTKILAADVTEQVRRACYGGVITVEVDVGGIAPPDDPNGHGGAFEPYVHGYEEISHEFTF